MRWILASVLFLAAGDACAKSRSLVLAFVLWNLSFVLWWKVLQTQTLAQSNVLGCAISLGLHVLAGSFLFGEPLSGRLLLSILLVLALLLLNPGAA